MQEFAVIEMRLRPGTATVKLDQTTLQSDVRLVQPPSELDKTYVSSLILAYLVHICKLLERLFLTRFQSHVCASGNFSSAQSSYRRHYSTETALIIMDSIFR